MNDFPDDDRMASPVGGRVFLKTKKARNLLIAAVSVGVGSFVAMGFYSAINDKGPAQKPDDVGATSIAQVTSSPPIPPIVEPTKPVETKTTANTAPPPAAPAATPAIVDVPTNYVQFPAGGGEGFFDVPKTVPAGKPTQTATGEKLVGASKTEVTFKPSVIEGGKAGQAIRMTYVMMPQLIPCALDTAMDSTLAGAIMCHTTVDVYSPEHVLLMSTHSLIMGTYKNDVKNGQKRLFAFSGSAFTQEGIPVPLDSGVADGVGRAGIPGDVDNHYAERFGAALLLTAFDSGISVLEAEQSKAGQTSLNFNSGSGASGLANQILQSQMTIAPTISVPPGTIVSIVVDHPIDFSDALKVEAVNER